MGYNKVFLFLVFYIRRPLNFAQFLLSGVRMKTFLAEKFQLYNFDTVKYFLLFYFFVFM